MRGHPTQIGLRAALLLALLAMLVAPAAVCAGCSDQSYQTDVDAALKAGPGGHVIGRMVPEEGVRVRVKGE